ncbi:hypothetical protein [Okeania sp. SIO1I7]|uniref:hypothetical protein n=1 Tax=Okeania sp. SIO1I7 TaxID=2607772 RepID=UPI0013FB95F9|nr:hypothetical protein [Okeania sp. SIO1I7]NET26678.1 hypothetical protein [Okeania sp. SIO1I7]
MLLLYTHGILGWFKSGKFQDYQIFIGQKEAENKLEKYSAFSNQITKEISKVQEEYHLERRFIL